MLDTHTPVLTEEKDLFIDNSGQMNVLIEGDNFASLKLLEKTHKGKIDLVYIDPPYNTLKDGFTYSDKRLKETESSKEQYFEFLTQWDVNLIVNHINSTPRESLGGRTPYDVALETLGEEVLNAFQLRPIAPDEVNLTPKLIRFNH